VAEKMSIACTSG